MIQEISVIIPTHTPKDYLWECLECLNNQTLDKKAYEVIIILNGEKDPYFHTITERLATFTFSYTLLYTQHKGVSYARNLGIEHAKGKFITFIDDDDLISNYYLEELKKNACCVGITEANVIAFKDNKENIVHHYLSKAYRNYNNQAIDLVKNRSFLSSSCCKLIPRDIIDKNRFRVNLTHGEDAFFMFVLSKKIKKINVTSSNAIYYIRIRETSASRSKHNRGKKKKMELKLIFIYTIEYIRHPLKYNFLLYATRILATLKKIITE